jgi:hypothetical protein
LLSGTLVTASSLTLKWLEIIKTIVLREIPSSKYYEAKHYASFKNPFVNRRFSQLNPLPKEIRLFLKIPITFDLRLEPTPSSSGWAKSYPVIFKVRSESDAEKAGYLIIESYKSDLNK